MNLHVIVGRVGQDPELKYLPSGDAVCNLGIATDEVYRRDGEKVTKTTWHRVTFYGQSAESVAQHVRKGRSIVVQGQVRRKQVDDENGKREFVDTVARFWEFAGSANGGAGNGGGQRNGQRPARRQTRPQQRNPRGGGQGQSNAFHDVEDDSDIPF